MITSHHCSVCGRFLALATNDGSRGTQYCPDRPCILYPPVSTSRAEDPTISTWVMAVRTTTRVTSEELSRAMGYSPGWARTVVFQQRKRWQRAV